MAGILHQHLTVPAMGAGYCEEMSVLPSAFCIVLLQPVFSGIVVSAVLFRSLKVRVLVALLLLLSASLTAQTGTVTGSVTDRRTGSPLSGVAVYIDGHDTGIRTGVDGSFSIGAASGECVLVFRLPGYRQSVQDINISGDRIDDIGKIVLVPVNEVRRDAATLIVNDISDDGGPVTQGYQAVLSPSADIFQLTAAYTFKPFGFRQRGYDNSYTAVMINGFLIKDVKTGDPLWDDWDGLGDVMQNAVVTDSPEATGYMFEPAGGLVSIITNASQYRTGMKMVYSLSNRSFNNRASLTWSSDELPRNWSVTGSASRRWSQSGFVEGTFLDAWSVFVTAEKKINAFHAVNITALDAIYARGVNGAATREVYDLAGSNYYNPYWGYQNGRPRNSKIRSANKPLLTITHTWDINNDTRLKTTAGYWSGKKGSTALAWYDAPDPRPDYYEYLPSYFLSDHDRDRITALWNDPMVSHIDWYHFYFANSKNRTTVDDADGVLGNAIEGIRSKYIVAERHDDLKQLQLNTVFSHDSHNGYKLTGGTMLNIVRGFDYNIVKDLLGGYFWLDVDQVAERFYPDNPMIIQNDLNVYNNIVVKGEVFGHSYISYSNQATVWALGEWNPGRMKAWLQGSISLSSLWREGKMQKGLFADDSYGKSARLSFLTWGVKAGGNYRFNGRHYLTFSSMLQTNPPLFNSAFLSPRTRNEILSGIGAETVFSSDAGYTLSLPYLSARITGYYARFLNQSGATSVYHDILRSFRNYSMTGIDKEHTGIELGVEWYVTRALSVNTVAAIGRFVWKDNPSLTITTDNSIEVVRSDEVRLKGFSVDGTPQTALAFGVDYDPGNSWRAGITASCFDRNFAGFNPAARISDLPGHYPWQSAPVKLPRAFLLDASLGKLWHIKRYYLDASANLGNLTNRTGFPVSGFEQYGDDTGSTAIRDLKLYYYFGFNFFVNISIRF